MNTDQFDWVDFYREFSRVLLGYKDNRKELVQIIRSTYQNIGIAMPTLEKDNQVTDIDPFTVFGLFNKSSMKEVNRLKIISSFAEAFDVHAAIPTSFDGVPVLNNQNATFYYFAGEREEGDIEALWDLFESAIRYSDDPAVHNKQLLAKHFDLVINKKGNGNSKITMGLFWIVPGYYLNLDRRNTWYIYESGKIPEEIMSSLPAVDSKIAFDTYFTIMEKLRDYLSQNEGSMQDFIELSFEAWRYSEKVNNEGLHEKGKGLADDDVRPVHYWLYSPGDGAEKWKDFYEHGVMGIGWGEIGDLSQYEMKKDIKNALQKVFKSSASHKNSTHAAWQFAYEIAPGDIVFVKKGKRQLIGRGTVSSDYYFDTTVDEAFPNLRQVNWTHNYIDDPLNHPGSAAVKTLTDITPYTEYVDKLSKLFEVDEQDDAGSEPEISYPAYDEEKFLDEVFMDKEHYQTLVGLIRTKKNVILQGAPGVGKTYAAKRLAYSMMGEKDQERVMMIQFHQSYSYEDFIEGFRPSLADNGFEIKKGSFYNFCQRASDDLDQEYFFIIDEINRGNVSKIFGELFMLIENDKRGNALQLLYSDEKFAVPVNVHIIGLMNTADRSLAMLDYALRRRFAFYELRPGFDTNGFKAYQSGLNSARFDRLIQCVENLNTAITDDESLGENFCIGHSYFCELDGIQEKALSNIVEYELIPLLKEYWFDEPQKIRDWASSLRRAIV